RIGVTPAEIIKALNHVVITRLGCTARGGTRSKSYTTKDYMDDAEMMLYEIRNVIAYTDDDLECAVLYCLGPMELDLPEDDKVLEENEEETRLSRPPHHATKRARYKAKSSSNGSEGLGEEENNATYIDSQEPDPTAASVRIDSCKCAAAVGGEFKKTINRQERNLAVLPSELKRLVLANQLKDLTDRRIHVCAKHITRFDTNTLHSRILKSPPAEPRSET
ncbi:MAG: hypothetical protein Q9190_007897, partial [Brigantiaea leucoxantha]